MKKLLLLILACPALGWASYQPIAGSTVTVVETAGGAVRVKTTGGANLGVDLSTGVSVNTKGQPNLGVDLSTGVSVNTKGQPNLGVDLSTGVRVNTSGGPNLGVDLSTGVRVNTSGGPNIGVDFSTGVLVVNELLVSSNTSVPTAVADGVAAKQMGDKYGRAVTMPIVPWGEVRVATATLTTTTAETIFISSPSSGLYIRLIGCIGENTSSTAADITFRMNGGPSQINAGSFPLGTSVSNVPVGFFPPRGIEQTVSGVNITIQGSASVTSLKVTCWYDTE